MKKIMVIFFLFLLSSAEWQARDELKLPKELIVNDIKVSGSGRIWILTKTSLSHIDFNTKNIVSLMENRNGRLFTINNEERPFLIDNNNRIFTFDAEGTIRTFAVALTNPIQIEVIKVDKKNVFVVSEGDRLIFTDGDEILGTLNTSADKFAVYTNSAENKTAMVIYTLTNNQIHAWTSSNLLNPAAFKNQLIFSTSEYILDFAIGNDGKNYILLKDSIIVLKPSGEYERRIRNENTLSGSKLLINPVDNSLVLFNRNEKTLKMLSRTTQPKDDIIILHKNRPNPVDNYTEFEFTLNEPMLVTLTIYNLIGKPVKVVANGHYQKGTHTVVWHADDEKGILVPNGVYFYRLESKKGVLIKQLIVLR